MKKRTLRVISVALAAATIISTVLSVPVFAYGKSVAEIQTEDESTITNMDESTSENLGRGISDKETVDDVSVNSDDIEGDKDVGDGSGDSVKYDAAVSDEEKKSEKTVVFTCKGDGVTVTAETKPENEIPESAVLHADKLIEGSEEYNKAMEKARNGLQLSDEQSLYYAPYDVYFTNGEEKIEPESGTVKVRMEFDKDPFDGISFDDKVKVLYATSNNEDPVDNIGTKNLSLKREATCTNAKVGTCKNLGIDTKTKIHKLIIHILENNKIEKINTKICSNTEIEFNVKQFSIMGIATYASYELVVEHLYGVVGTESGHPCSISITGPSFSKSFTLEAGAYQAYSVAEGTYTVSETPNSYYNNASPSSQDALVNHKVIINLMHSIIHTNPVTPTPSPKPSPTPTPGGSGGSGGGSGGGGGGSVTPAPTPGGSGGGGSGSSTSNLLISKTLNGSNGDNNQLFTFNIVLSGTSAASNFTKTCSVTSTGTVNYSGSTISFTNGKASVQLKNGQEIKIWSLPTGSIFNVTEQQVDGYKQTMASGTSGSLTANSNLYAHFWNSKVESSSLKIKKTVTGPDADQNKQFNFYIALSGSYDATNFSKSCSVTSMGTVLYSGSTINFTNGHATVQLKHNQSIKIEGLPINCAYTVTEQEANQGGYETTKTGDTGTLSVGSTPEAIFTNHKEDTGSLKLTKKVTGTGGETDKEWNFNIQLSGTKASTFTQLCNVTSTGTPAYSDATIKFTNGVANVKLKHGQSITIQGLPSEHTYTVTETEANQKWYKTTKTNDTGTIPKNGTAEATFTNNKDVGDLKISNTVTGTSGDLNKEWTIDIDLNGDNIADFNETCEVQSAGTVQYTDGSVTFNGGKAKIHMKSGQEIIIKKIPAGFTYTVSEEEANTDGYTTSGTGLTGSISKDTPAKVEFVNNKPQTSTLPSTGGSGTKNLMFLSILLLTVGAAIAKVVFSKKIKG